MSYSNDLKPAKILNLPNLIELANRIYLTRNSDVTYYSQKEPGSNAQRYVFGLETSDIDVKPTARIVQVINKNKKYTGYESFLIEPKSGCKGIAIVMIKEDDNKNFFCNVRTLPLTQLKDIVAVDTKSDTLTVNLGSVDLIIKVDVTITPSNTGEALYFTHDVSVGDVAQFISPDEILTLTKDLEFHGAKIAAHFCQEMLDIVLAEEGKTPVPLTDEYILSLPNNILKELLVASTIIGNVALEITGVNAIKDINRDWEKASQFIGYML